jgi:hypothetical protein
VLLPAAQLADSCAQHADAVSKRRFQSAILYVINSYKSQYSTKYCSPNISNSDENNFVIVPNVIRGKVIIVEIKYISIYTDITKLHNHV